MSNQEINGGMSAEELAYENQYKPIHLDPENVNLIIEKQRTYNERLEKFGARFGEEIPNDNFEAMHTACQIAWCAALIEAHNKGLSEVTINDARDMFTRMFAGEPEGFVLEKAYGVIKQYAEEAGEGLVRVNEDIDSNKKVLPDYIESINEVSKDAGREFEVNELQAGDIFTINTENSTYEFYIINPKSLFSLCRKNGQKYFYTSIVGTSFGGSSVKTSVITEGLRFTSTEFDEEGRYIGDIISSPVIGFNNDRASKNAKDFVEYIHQNPFPGEILS